MIRSTSMRVGRATATGKKSAGCAGLAAAALALALTGCSADDAWKTFRAASGDQLQTSLQSLFTGVTDGLFAIYDQSTPSSTSTNSSTTSTSGG